MTGSPRALVAVSDLFHLPRVEAAVRAAGFEPVLIMREADLDRALARPPALAVIDLALKSLDPLAVIARLRAADAVSAPGGGSAGVPGAARRTPIAAFGSHVQVELMQAARQAGADDVFPNSALVADLPARLRAMAARDAG